MKKTVLSALALIVAASAVLAEEQDVERRMMERRAAEAVIWGMPAVNYDIMLQEMLTKTGGKVNQVIYWGKPLDWKNQTLTPNPDTLYLMSFFNTKDAGPIVIEIPPATAEGSLNANFVNIWQVPLEDAGLLGADKGKGMKVLVLPPGYSEPVPDGYHAVRPGTYGSYALIRSSMKSHDDADVAKSISYAKQIKVYPLSLASSPPATVFSDVKDVLYDTTIRYDDSFFVHLDRIVQTEPWLDRDRVMIDPLRTLGIEKGRTFAPDAATREALTAGVREAQIWMEAKYDAAPPPFFEGTHWTYPGHPELIKAASEGYADPNTYPTDWRGLVYSYAYIGIKRMGAGQFYLLNIKDKEGARYDGGKTYRLHVPANVPVEQYWSLTAYDRQTHALIKNVARASRASNASEVKTNADGSVDLFIGPKAPDGHDANWIPTDPARSFELMFRLYGPKPEFFEKTWALPDVEKLDKGASTASSGLGRPHSSDPIPVTVDNFIRAESDMYLAGVVNDYGFGKLGHRRAPAPIDHQTVIRLNRDTLYSAGVFDLDAGPVTITLPDAGGRFMSMQVINEDHYVMGVYYGPGARTLDRNTVGTRYVVTAFRTLVDPSDSGDVAEVHALQDAIKVEQASTGAFVIPDWEPVSQKKVRDALLVLGATIPDFRMAFGAKGEVDPVRHLIASAAAWGGNPDKDATYLNITPKNNDGTTVYRLDVKDVPVDGFWSVSLYNAEGYYERNPLDAYTFNNITARKGDDGAISIQFGGCDGKIPNCLPIMKGWNYTVRLYRPRAEILDGSWRFPEPQPVAATSAEGAGSGEGKD